MIEIFWEEVTKGGHFSVAPTNVIFNFKKSFQLYEYCDC